VWLGRVPLRWVLENTDYQQGSRFEQKLVRGPFSAWYHTHVFFDDERGGTILRDEIDYELPLGPVGVWLLHARVRRRLGRLFKYRHQQTRKIVEANDFPGAPAPRASTKPDPVDLPKDRRIDPTASHQTGGPPAVRGGLVF
jgi:hypothetical protein